jgi:hypothetical protein
MTIQLVSNMILFASHLCIWEPSETLVNDSRIEQQLYVFIGLRELASPQNDRWYSFFSNTIHDMDQEPVGIIWFIFIKLTSKLVFQFSYINSLSVIHQLCWSVDLSEHILKNFWERLAFLLISILEEEPGKLLVVREEVEDCWDKAILWFANQLEIAVKITDIVDFLLLCFVNLRENDLLDFMFILNVFII